MKPLPDIFLHVLFLTLYQRRRYHQVNNRTFGGLPERLLCAAQS
jgi:hypothetical protein